MKLKRKRQCVDELDDSEDEDDGCHVTTYGNSIYFYSTVTRRSVLRLNMLIDVLNHKLGRSDVKGMDYNPVINIFINSEGGSLHDGLSAMDHIKASKIPITTIIDGQCASAATFISIGGRQRKIKSHAFILMHQLSVEGFWGKYDDLKDECRNCDRIMQTLVGVYTETTNMNKKKVKDILSRELYMDAKEAIVRGIAHSIY